MSRKNSRSEDRPSHATPDTGPPKRLIPLREAARITSTSLRFIQRSVAAGELRVVELSPRCRRIELSQLDQWIRQNTRGGGA